MDFKSWLLHKKNDEPDFDVFITKLEPFFTDAGFNGLGFEKKINIGLRKFDNDIDELLKPKPNVKNQ